MKNETFGDTFERVLCDVEYDVVIGVGNTQKVFDEIYVSVSKSFHDHGEFLDIIPIHDREKVISTDILTWMINYSQNDVNRELNRLTPHTKPAYRERNKIIKTIEDFESMILDNFSYLEVSINLNREFDLKSKAKDINNLAAIKKLLATTETLKNDLSKEEYKIFPKNKFLPLDRTPKDALEEILKKLIDDYNIKGYTDHLTPLITSITTL